MPLTSAKKQALYCARHLGVDGTKTAIHLFVDATTRAKLKRLAHGKGRTMTALVEELATRAESRVTAQLSDIGTFRAIRNSRLVVAAGKMMAAS